MLELPELITLSKQISENLKDKVIQLVVAVQSPHKFAWYH